VSAGENPAKADTRIGTGKQGRSQWVSARLNAGATLTELLGGLPSCGRGRGFGDAAGGAFAADVNSEALDFLI
jgi:hypothetical protein